MSKKVKFYEIKIIDKTNDKILDTKEILKTLEKERLSEDGKNYVYEISGKNITFFRFINDNDRSFVIPFGCDKKSAVYKGDEDKTSNTIPKDIKEITDQLYDISSFYYNSEEDIVLFCKDQTSPSIKDVRIYLTKSLNNIIDDEYEVKINPIIYNTGIESLRRASAVKNIVIVLDLSEPIQNIYNETANETFLFFKVFREIAQASYNDIGAKTFSLQIGVGRGGKNVSMSINSVLHMLAALNLDTDLIKEVKVKYLDGGSQNIMLTQLKETQLELYYEYSDNNIKTVSPIYLSLHAKTALDAKRDIYREFLRNRR